MIPRFIITNITHEVLKYLRMEGFEVDSNLTVTTDILVLGTHMLPSTISIKEKNPLLKVLDARTDTKDVLVLAELHKRWNASATKIELLLGDPPQGKVIVCKVGVIIDSCLIPITQFHQLEQTLLGFKNPFIVTHEPLINKKKAFLTIGCADYSMDDISKVLTTYYSIP